MIAEYGKRALALFLAIVMMFSAVPVQVFATEHEDHDHPEETIAATSEPAEVTSEPTEATSEPSVEPGESEALITLRADIADYIKTYGLTADMPDSVLEDVYFGLYGDQLDAALFDVEDFIERAVLIWL